MKMGKRVLGAVLAVVIAPQAQAQSAQTPEAAVRAYFQAESGFQQQALAAVLATDFVEISPVGDVDERDKVLGFYDPANKVALPEVTLSAIQVRGTGESAFVTASARYVLGGQARELVFGIGLRHQRDGWKLVSAQATPKPPGAGPKPSGG